MIDPDVFQQLAADLDAKTDACIVDTRHAADLGDDRGALYHESKGIAYADVADWIRTILADEQTTTRQDGTMTYLPQPYPLYCVEVDPDSTVGRACLVIGWYAPNQPGSFELIPVLARPEENGAVRAVTCADVGNEDPSQDAVLFFGTRPSIALSAATDAATFQKAGR